MPLDALVRISSNTKPMIAAVTLLRLVSCNDADNTQPMCPGPPVADSSAGAKRINELAGRPFGSVPDVGELEPVLAQVTSR